MNHKLEFLYQLSLGSMRTTPLIEAIQARGVAIGASATNKLRLLRADGYVMNVKTDDSAERLWSITDLGRAYLKESLAEEEKPREYQFYKQQGYML